MREQTDPNTVNSSVGKGRKYLTEREVEQFQSQKRDRPARCFHPCDRRFRRGSALLDGETSRALHARERLVAVGVDLSGVGPDGMAGYRAKRHSG